MEDEAEGVAAQFGALGVAHAAQVGTTEDDGAGGRLNDAGERVQQKVDLPEPDGPITATVSPSRSVKFTWFRASVCMVGMAKPGWAGWDGWPA